MDYHIAWDAVRGFCGRYDLEFDNECGCLFEQPILEKAVIQECNRRNILPKERYKIYPYRGYAGISIKHDKVSIHRIIGNYMANQTLESNIVVHHIDGNKMNNTILNLQILRKELHTKEHNLVQYVDKNKLAKNAYKGSMSIKRHDVTDKEIRKLRMEGLTYKQIAEILHCGYNTVWRRLRKLDWSDEE